MDAVLLYKEYRGQSIGSQLMVKMLELLKWQGYERASLAVQKANYTVKMYKDVGVNGGLISPTEGGEKSPLQDGQFCQTA